MNKKVVGNKLSFHKIKDESEISILEGLKSVYKKNFIYKYNKGTIDFLKKNLEREDSLYIIVRQGGMFVAFVSIDSQWWEKESFFIREIFIKSSFQRYGLGKKLMEKCIEHAKKYNAKTIVTQTAFENIPMQKLCKKLGFKEWNNPQWNEGITYKLNIR